MSLPPVEIPSGAMRFNSDSQKLEYYDGAQWLEVSTKETLTGSGRGLFGGGETPSSPSLSNVIDYITIATQGNAVDFGDLFLRRGAGACASSTRGVWGGGSNPLAAPAGFAPTNIGNVIDYVTISSTGNTQDFGDLTANKTLLGACSSSTRGLFMGGYITGGPTATIDFITISSTGNASNFGNLTQSRKNNPSSLASPTRGINGGGDTPANTNIIDYVTIASTGNAQDFGDLTAAKFSLTALSNNIRGLFGGGYIQPALVNTIEFITISTTGNASDFGDLTSARHVLSSCSSPIRGVFAGGTSNVNTIEYVSIQSTGNAVKFGELTVARSQQGGCSNAHGGL